MATPRDQENAVVADVVRAVASRLNSSDPKLQELIAQEVGAVLGARSGSDSLAGAARARPGATAERIVITSTGHNRPGVVARLATIIDEFAGDIRELSQTIVGDYFTMIFVVDIAGATSQGGRFATLKERLLAAAQDLGIHVVVLHDDILSAMHSV